jgi:hypothetical protein
MWSATPHANSRPLIHCRQTLTLKCSLGSSTRFYAWHWTSSPELRICCVYCINHPFSPLPRFLLHSTHLELGTSLCSFTTRQDDVPKHVAPVWPHRCGHLSTSCCKLPIRIRATQEAPKPSTITLGSLVGPPVKLIRAALVAKAGKSHRKPNEIDSD